MTPTSLPIGGCLVGIAPSASQQCLPAVQPQCRPRHGPAQPAPIAARAAAAAAAPSTCCARVLAQRECWAPLRGPWHSRCQAPRAQRASGAAAAPSQADHLRYLTCGPGPLVRAAVHPPAGCAAQARPSPEVDALLSKHIRRHSRTVAFPGVHATRIALLSSNAPARSCACRNFDEGEGWTVHDITGKVHRTLRRMQCLAAVLLVA